MAVLVSSLALAPRAEAYIYWSGPWSGYSGAHPNPAISRANLDGTGVNQDFIVGDDAIWAHPEMNANGIYWLRQAASDGIARANLDGTGLDLGLLTLPVDLQGYERTSIEVDANHVYWTHDTPPVIGRANLDGTGANPEFIRVDPTEFVAVSGLTVDDNHIYWARGGTGDSSEGAAIGRANLDGTGVDHHFIDIPTDFPFSDDFGFSDLAVSANHIYWVQVEFIVTSPGVSIGRANLDGTGANPDFLPLSSDSLDHQFIDLAVDANHIFWTHERAGALGSIGRANLDGTGANPEFIKNRATYFLQGIAVDAGSGVGGSADQGVEGIKAYCKGVAIGQQACLLALHCDGDTECEGKVKLLFRYPTGLAGKAAGETNKKQSTFGKARFSIPPGESEDVELRLTAKAKKLIKAATTGKNRKRKLRATVKITGTHPSTEKVQIKLRGGGGS